MDYLVAGWTISNFVPLTTAIAVIVRDMTIWFIGAGSSKDGQVRIPVLKIIDFITFLRRFSTIVSIGFTCVWSDVPSSFPKSTIYNNLFAISQINFYQSVAYIHLNQSNLFNITSFCWIVWNTYYCLHYVCKR